MDEGAEKVLDALQERACVNTLFLTVFTFGRDIVGRKIPRSRCPITASRNTISTFVVELRYASSD